MVYFFHGFMKFGFVKMIFFNINELACLIGCSFYLIVNINFIPFMWPAPLKGLIRMYVHVTWIFFYNRLVFILNAFQLPKSGTMDRLEQSVRFFFFFIYFTTNVILTDRNEWNWTYLAVEHVWIIHMHTWAVTFYTRQH